MKRSALCLNCGMPQQPLWGCSLGRWLFLCNCADNCRLMAVPAGSRGASPEGQAASGRPGGHLALAALWVAQWRAKVGSMWFVGWSGSVLREAMATMVAAMAYCFLAGFAMACIFSQHSCAAPCRNSVLKNSEAKICVEHSHLKRIGCMNSKNTST